MMGMAIEWMLVALAAGPGIKAIDSGFRVCGAVTMSMANNEMGILEVLGAGLDPVEAGRPWRQGQTELVICSPGSDCYSVCEGRRHWPAACRPLGDLGDLARCRRH